MNARRTVAAGTADSRAAASSDASCQTGGGRQQVRSSLHSLAVSAAVHLAAASVLSLIVITQRPWEHGLQAEVRFEEQQGTGDSFQLTPELDMPIPEDRRLQLQSLEATLQSGGPPLITDLQVDFSQFARQSGGQLSQADAVAAAGIQDRVQKAGGATGEVQFSLAWQSFNDLDLHVIAPSGEHVAYRNRTSRCRGELDVDMNVEPESETPVENIRWASRAAPMGRYLVIVHQYQWRQAQATDDFRLLVRLGEQVQVVEGSVQPGASMAIYRFQYIRPSLPESRRARLADELTRLQEREERQAGVLLEQALPLDRGGDRDERMLRIIRQFPHTDASLRAMQELQAEPKQGSHGSRQTP